MTDTDANLPKAKQTVLGLYVTAREAYEQWRASPDKVKIIDVRTPEEFMWVGHAPMAWKIPLVAVTYAMGRREEAVSRAAAAGLRRPGAEDRDAGRHADGHVPVGRPRAMAVNLLAQAGFKHVYNITDGMEGDAVKDADSVFVGQRLKNGWKNAGCPWTYEIAPDHMLLPARQAERTRSRRSTMNDTQAANWTRR